MRKGDTTFFAVLVIVVIVVIVFVTLAFRADERRESEQEREARFAGACALLDGEVEGDVCIKGDTVVLTRKEFESK